MSDPYNYYENAIYNFNNEQTDYYQSNPSKSTYLRIPQRPSISYARDCFGNIVVYPTPQSNIVFTNFYPGF